ncbi:hypothetical protein HU200_005328 [Digitaria exilis]|uniref:cytokinin riboside 5'-monophosphate phosphoribohydrolase n=1 Tax=Digitaria exilis TaxID=1010633 RepID=A0A835FTM2_9POAL|nr:hypothetical protein HU200_005328 [Digitaria exilis]
MYLVGSVVQAGRPLYLQLNCVCSAYQGSKDYLCGKIEQRFQIGDIDLVYGGGSLGLMGLVSHAVHRGGRHVVGVVPRALMTSPEVGLLNVDGYYDSLLAFIDQAMEEGFISPSARRIIVQAPSAHELMEKLEVVIARLEHIYIRMHSKVYVTYYDKVASELDWETRMIAKDPAIDGSGIGVPSYNTDQNLPPWEKPVMSPVKESPLTMEDKSCSLGIGEVETSHQLTPIDETDEAMTDASRP